MQGKISRNIFLWNTFLEITTIVLAMSVAALLGKPEDVTVSNEGLREWLEVFRVLQGSEIWDATSGDNGDQSWGRRVSYDFGNQAVSSIDFTSTMTRSSTTRSARKAWTNSMPS